jgi:hypothetical protein
MVTRGGNATSASVAAEAAGNVLHFVWSAVGGPPSPNILHAASSGAWAGLPLTGLSVLDGTTGILEAASPKVAVTGSGAAAGVFAVWQDRRTTMAGDTDIMFAQMKGSGAFGTNIYVSRVVSGSARASATNPSFGVSPDGAPYAAWTDQREGASHIYFSEATYRRPLGDLWTVPMSGGTHSFTDPTNPHMAEVDITVPPNTFPTPVTLTVSELQNPNVLSPNILMLYPNGGGLCLDISGANDLALAGPVTITIHLQSGYTFTPPALPYAATMYRLQPPASILDNWNWITTSITNPPAYDQSNAQLTVETTRLSVFGLGASTGGGNPNPPPSSGGGGGGCSLARGNEPDLTMLLLPLSAVTLWLGLRMRRKATRT